MITCYFSTFLFLYWKGTKQWRQSSRLLMQLAEFRCWCWQERQSPPCKGIDSHRGCLLQWRLKCTETLGVPHKNNYLSAMQRRRHKKAEGLPQEGLPQAPAAVQHRQLNPLKTQWWIHKNEEGVSFLGSSHSLSVRSVGLFQIHWSLSILRYLKQCDFITLSAAKYSRETFVLVLWWCFPAVLQSY